MVSFSQNIIKTKNVIKIGKQKWTKSKPQILYYYVLKYFSVPSYVLFYLEGKLINERRVLFQ